MELNIIDEKSYGAMSAIQKGFFDGFRKGMISMFDDGTGIFPEEVVQAVEKSAFVFVGELADETINPSKYYPVVPIAGANANKT